MPDPAPSCTPRSVGAWAVVLVFAVLCLCWGTTFFVIREGVKHFPPALFGGVRVGLGGAVLLLYLLLRRAPMRLPLCELPGTILASLLLFVGGNGLITLGLGVKGMASGAAAILGATTPLWMALLEMCWPRGDRLAWWGWLGLLAGLGGVSVLLPPPQHPEKWLQEPGPFLVVGSAFFWALGSLLLRYQRRTGPHLAAAAFQMLIGGGALAVTGLVCGEAQFIGPERFTLAAIGAFFYLLVFGSLVGYVAYTWLLDHVSAALAGMYAYVTPVVALLVGWLLADEPITLPMVGAMVVILASVALVRAGSKRRERRSGASWRKSERLTRHTERRSSTADGRPAVR